LKVFWHTEASLGYRDDMVNLKEQMRFGGNGDSALLTGEVVPSLDPVSQTSGHKSTRVSTP
jgi:hypothetical protein